VTPGYSPPEQYGQGHTDARTDIYALGATLYMMLTGINPVESPTRLTGVQLTGVRIQNALVTPATEQTIMRAMALDPKYRFQTASDFAAALSATPPTILNPPIPPTVVVTPPPPSTPTTNWWALIPIPLVCILVATLALFVAAVTLNANNNATATGRAEQTEVAVRVEATNEAYAAETSLTETAEAEVRATEAEADRLATGTARSELTAVAATQTAAARPTNTPRPTATLRVSRPTATPVVNATAPVGSNCSITVTGRFARLWEKYRSTLGCPFNASEKGISDAEQRFQGGHMFWRQDTDRYYVVYDAGGASGSWAVYSRATGGNCSESPPAGYWKPTSGFGDVWCTKLGGSTSTLGWALDHEYGFVSSQGIRVQDFQFGTIFQDSDGANRNLVYVLMRTGFAREAP
jgi:hypothetical protein